MFTDCKISGNMNGFFYGLNSLVSVDFTGADLSEVTSMNGLFGKSDPRDERIVPEISVDFANCDLSNVISVHSMFSNNKILELKNLKLKTAAFLFSYCEIDNISGLDTSEITDMSDMFRECTSSNLDLSHFDTSKVTDVSEMFCESTELETLDLSNFDTSNVTNMWAMFWNNESLEELDPINFNTSKVTNAARMVECCYSLKKLDISNMDLSNIENDEYKYAYLINKCYALEEIKVPKKFGEKAYFFYPRNRAFADENNVIYPRISQDCAGKTLHNVAVDDENKDHSENAGDQSGNDSKPSDDNKPSDNKPSDNNKPSNSTDSSTSADGWRIENGIPYWYENNIKQGTEGSGKEIYDPDSKAWYWLDAVDGGKMAVSKDVYQESLVGDWGDIDNGNGTRNGKWVRYDENGHMIKGWNEKDGNRYYFDPTFGTMANGLVC